MVTLLNKKRFFGSIIIGCVVFSSCQKTLRFDPDPAPTHHLQVRFKPMVGADSLQFGPTYQNISGESYTVRNFKFYITQVELSNTDSARTYKLNKDEYFLVDFADPVSIQLSLDAVAYKYNRISFTLG